ncbi:MAG TPA: hypothetical protein ENJ13_01545 [Chromatiales bacterium]|nr:hypothetical protein [Chromatiales bacterium]
MKQGLGWLLAAIFMVTLASCGADGQQDSGWLLGKWELAYNPENDDDDALIFDSDDTVTVLAEKGGKMQGTYQYVGNQVRIALPTSRQTINVEFEVSSDHSKLIYKSGAYYMKQ